MAAISIPSISTEFIIVTVHLDNPDINPSDFDVSIAIVSSGLPEDNDFSGATWENDEDARVLIGPGTAFDLPAGIYNVWVKVDATPEEVVLKAGRLTIT